ncbi:MAG: hypothetical protein E7624_07185 [Ruminococcaceae bacterium]|nr:hypothetical protein [Oscillospiraceae bacterium]
MDFSPQDMKPIFCTDITADEDNEVINGAEFVTRTAPKEKIESFERRHEALLQTIKKSKLPTWLQFIRPICGFLFAAVLIACIRTGFPTAFQNAPILVIGGALCGVLWILLQVFSKVKEKKMLKEGTAEQQSKHVLEELQSIHAEMDVPADAVEIDVLTFAYQAEDGKICPRTVALQTTPYLNVTVKMYATPDSVHVADLENVYSFERSSLKAITTVKKRICVPTWNKDEDPRKGSYKPYKMTVNGLGNIYFKPYHILEIEREGERFGLYFPCYELETVEKLTGLQAEKGDAS